jgi:ABC-type siderophore export system fused ATPase/permease subunit
MSLCNLFISRLIIILFIDWINRILVAINSNPTAVLVQFNGRLLISVFVSKTENRFLITFNLFC